MVILIRKGDGGNMKCPKCDKVTKSYPTLVTHMVYEHDMRPSDASKAILEERGVKDAESSSDVPVVQGRYVD